jgi:hypothetical protein
MKKSLSALLVIILSMIGAKAFAAKVDVNVNRVIKETSDSSGDLNGSVKSCGNKKGNGN